MRKTAPKPRGGYKGPRRGRRTKKTTKKSVAIVKNPVYRPGFPKEQVVKMRYVANFNINPSVTTIYQFRANSIFDPDYTATGHQPIGHDQWTLFYNHYIVLGAKATCRFMMTQDVSSNTPLVPLIFFNYLSDDSTVSSNPFLLAEQGKCRYKLINGNLPVASTRDTTLVQYYSPKKFFNVKDVKDNMTRLGASFGNNPAEDAIITIGIGCADPSGSNPNDNYSFVMTIEYSVLLSEPKELAQS